MNQFMSTHQQVQASALMAENVVAPMLVIHVLQVCRVSPCWIFLFHHKLIIMLHSVNGYL
jgi:hypothetical protein